jgi:cell division protein FtsB
MTIYELVKKYNVSKTVFVSYFACFAVIIYFICCAIFGQKGLFSYFSLNNKIFKQDLVKQDLQNKMQVKKNMVEGMNVESLDLDLLDEEARRALGYSHKNEVVIYQNSKQDLSNNPQLKPETK